MWQNQFVIKCLIIEQQYYLFELQPSLHNLLNSSFHAKFWILKSEQNWSKFMAHQVWLIPEKWDETIWFLLRTVYVSVIRSWLRFLW